MLEWQETMKTILRTRLLFIYMNLKNNSRISGWIRNEKGIPAHKIGKQWKFKCSELDAWVKSGKSALD